MHNWELGIRITHLIQLGITRRAHGKPVLIRIVVDTLALVEESHDTVAKYVRAEIPREFLVQVDVQAVRVHAFHVYLGGFFAGVCSRGVCAVRGPLQFGKIHLLADRFEKEAVCYCEGGARGGEGGDEERRCAREEHDGVDVSVCLRGLDI